MHLEQISSHNQSAKCNDKDIKKTNQRFDYILNLFKKISNTPIKDETASKEEYTLLNHLNECPKGKGFLEELIMGVTTKSGLTNETKTKQSAVNSEVCHRTRGNLPITKPKTKINEIN